ncbi:MAG: slipin family protein [Planctomycetaceae bacterium]|nr:slipin family protein [Planctomycetaceae bacterium]
MFWDKVKIQNDEYGFHFVDDEFKEILKTGTHHFFDPVNKHCVEASSQLQIWLHSAKLEEIIFSGKLKGLAEVIDLNDNQRGLVWVDGRFHAVLEPGRCAYWVSKKNVAVEIVDAKNIQFQHKSLSQIAKTPSGKSALQQVTVPPYHLGLLYYNSKFIECVPAGLYAFWKNTVEVNVVCVDMRERFVDVSGQELMTADKVTLRMNTNACFQVVDAEKMARTIEDVQQVLYREIQLALRAVISRRELEQFLSDKNEIASESAALLNSRAESFGVKVLTFGIRDVILPGEMRDLLNKVTEAKKAAEADLIIRREETAAMRSQANTAKLLENNPTLMRLRELEVLERIAANGKLNIIVDEKKLTDRIAGLL